MVVWIANGPAMSEASSGNLLESLVWSKHRSEWPYSARKAKTQVATPLLTPMRACSGGLSAHVLVLEKREARSPSKARKGNLSEPRQSVMQVASNQPPESCRRGGDPASAGCLAKAVSVWAASRSPQRVESSSRRRPAMPAMSRMPGSTFTPLTVGRSHAQGVAPACGGPWSASQRRESWTWRSPGSPTCVAHAKKPAATSGGVPRSGMGPRSRAAD